MSNSHYRYSIEHKISDMQWNDAVRIRTHMVEWCFDMFGEPGQKWNIFLSTFHFINEEDAIMFKLRWKTE